MKTIKTENLIKPKPTGAVYRRILPCVLLLAALTGTVATENFESSPSFSPVFTWHAGVEGSYAYNYLYTSAGYRSFTEYDGEGSFSVGIPVKFKIFDWLALQIEPQYIQKNYTWKRSGLYDGVYNTYTNSFVSFPVFAQFSWKLYRGLSIFANAGGYLGIWAHSNIRGTAWENTENIYDPSRVYTYSYNETVSFDSRRDNRFDAGLLAGLGVQYEFPRFTVFAEGRFNYGLTDLQKKYMAVQIPRMNNTWEFRAGLLVNISALTGGVK